MPSHLPSLQPAKMPRLTKRKSGFFALGRVLTDFAPKRVQSQGRRCECAKRRPCDSGKVDLWVQSLVVSEKQVREPYAAPTPIKYLPETTTKSLRATRTTPLKSARHSGKNALFRFSVKLPDFKRDLFVI